MPAWLKLLEQPLGWLKSQAELMQVKFQLRVIWRFCVDMPAWCAEFLRGSKVPSLLTQDHCSSPAGLNTALKKQTNSVAHTYSGNETLHSLPPVPFCKVLHAFQCQFVSALVACFFDRVPPPCFLVTNVPWFENWNAETHLAVPSAGLPDSAPDQLIVVPGNPGQAGGALGRSVEM